MNIIVFLVGLLISLMSIFFILNPSFYTRFFEKYWDKEWLVWAVIFRLAIGTIFILSSSDTRFPHFVFWLGILTLISGITLPIVGKERVKKIFKRWLDKPKFVQIIWTLSALIFGLFIIYSANI